MMFLFDNVHILGRYIQIKDLIFIIFSIICYVLRGFAYKKLENSYLGFIPIIGDIICMLSIGNEYGFKHKVKYVVSSLISVVVKHIIPKILHAFLIYSGMVAMAAYADIMLYLRKSKPVLLNWLLGASWWIVLIALIIVLIFMLFLLFNFIFRYMILRPLIGEIIPSGKVILFTFIFSLFPCIFYIWILKSKALEKWDEINT